MRGLHLGTWQQGSGVRSDPPYVLHVLEETELYQLITSLLGCLDLFLGHCSLYKGL